MMTYILVSMLIGVGIGTIIGAYFHEDIFEEEEYYVIEED